MERGQQCFQTQSWAHGPWFHSTERRAETQPLQDARLWGARTLIVENSGKKVQSNSIPQRRLESSVEGRRQCVMGTGMGTWGRGQSDIEGTLSSASPLRFSKHLLALHWHLGPLGLPTSQAFHQISIEGLFNTQFNGDFPELSSLSALSCVKQPLTLFHLKPSNLMVYSYLYCILPKQRPETKPCMQPVYVGGDPGKQRGDARKASPGKSVCYWAGHCCGHPGLEACWDPPRGCVECTLELSLQRLKGRNIGLDPMS